jgi:hypothetical protein
MKLISERAAILSWVCGVVLLVTFASTAFARDDERGKWKPDDKGLAQRVAALEAALAATQAELAQLKKNTVLELNGKLKLSKQNGYATALFTGVNVQVVNGLGQTATLNGLGNLIAGYNEPRRDGLEVCSNGSYENQLDCEANGFIWAVNHKSGSHNIVGGYGAAYSRYGGLVVGDRNAINGALGSVSGGALNTASALWSSVSGGYANAASGAVSSVSGGISSTASGLFSSVSGGVSNTASGAVSSVSGGIFSTASGPFSSVSGGVSNTASGTVSSVSGGVRNTASSDTSSVSGGIDNAASALWSSVSGGYANTAGGLFSSVSGGVGVTANGEGTWAAGGLCQPGQGGSCQKASVNAAKRPTLPKLPTLPKPQTLPTPSK